MGGEPAADAAVMRARGTRHALAFPAVHEWHATGQLSVPPAVYEPSQLQRLAWRSGLTAPELREWLRGEVERGRNGDRSSDLVRDQVSEIVGEHRLQTAPSSRPSTRPRSPPDPPARESRA